MEVPGRDEPGARRRGPDGPSGPATAVGLGDGPPAGGDRQRRADPVPAPGLERPAGDGPVVAMRPGDQRVRHPGGRTRRGEQQHDRQRPPGHEGSAPSKEEQASRFMIGRCLGPGNPRIGPRIATYSLEKGVDLGFEAPYAGFEIVPPDPRSTECRVPWLFRACVCSSRGPCWPRSHRSARADSAGISGTPSQPRVPRAGLASTPSPRRRRTCRESPGPWRPGRPRRAGATLGPSRSPRRSSSRPRPAAGRRPRLPRPAWRSTSAAERRAHAPRRGHPGRYPPKSSKLTSRPQPACGSPPFALPFGGIRSWTIQGIRSPSRPRTSPPKPLARTRGGPATGHPIDAPRH